MAKQHMLEELESEESDQETGSSEESDQETGSSGSEGDAESSSNEEDSRKPGSGLADVMTKILNKKIPAHKQTILLKGKTDRELRKAKLKKLAEEDGSGGKKQKYDDFPENYKEDLEKRQKKVLWENMGNIKPDPLEKDKERNLQKIATRGVVQLFNAVRKQQKDVEDQLTEAGSSIRKKDKIMKSVTKGAFLDLLKGTKVNVSSQESEKNNMEELSSGADNPKSTNIDQPMWSVLRDDFMLGAAKMKDWDKAV